MSYTLSNRVNNIKPSATLAVSDKAKALREQGIDIINLGAGEPDFDTPAFIQEAAIAAMQAGHTRYTAVDGIAPLKEAIIHKLKRDNQLDYQASQIIVSVGVKQSLYNLAQAVLNPGDEAIILAPYWVSYPAMTLLAGATPVVVTAGIDQEFKVTPEQLEAAITDKTKLLFINSPSNPSAKTYTRDELKALGEVLIQHPQVIIASDDIYEYVLWGQEPFTNIVNACPELYDRTVVMNGVSKAHCMTGWRIGFAAGHPDIIKGMKKIQSQSTSSPCSISQYAATAAFNAAKEDFFTPMLNAYHDRHDWIIPELNSIEGIKAIPGDGTFYAFFNVEPIIERLKLKDDVALTAYFLEKAHVAMVPGSAFGCPGYIRLSFATSMEKLKDALKRIKAALA